MVGFRAGFVSILLLFGSCLAQERAGVDPKAATPIVTSVLSVEHLSGSLEYWGRCNYNPDFPKVRAPKEGMGPAVAILREVFQDDSKMRISKDAGGLVRMIETDVPRDILNVVIKHVSFGLESSSKVYDLGPEADVQAIQRTVEVQDFMKANDVGPIQGGWGYQGGLVSGLAPKLKELSNVTVSQALDRIAEVDHGFWVYENCETEKGREVHFAFFPVR
jgi:hypothetical protein